MPSIKNDFDADNRSEIPVSSPWGIGILKQSGTTLTSPVMAQNGTRFNGGWLLNTSDNRFDLVADFDGDGREEIFVSSPWGIGLLKQSGNTFNSFVMAQNGTRFGGWLLNTADNRFGPTGDFDGDGRAEVLISSPWGIGVLKLSGNTFTVPMMAQNGTRFGGWLLNTADNRFSPVADFDGDGRAEILTVSPWGIGILKLSGNTFTVPMMAQNGTRLGGWLLNTADNRFDLLADFDGDKRDEILVSSPWGLGILKLSGNTLISPVMAANGTRFGGWLLNTADNYFVIGEEVVRLHVKILTTPNISIENMVVSMQQVYESVGLRVHRVSTENLNLPTLNDVDVGACTLGSVTAEQTQLFSNRNNAGPNDVVAYFVRSTVPPYNGCASHPAGRPGAVVAQGATTWTLAHEIGHVLGLFHVNNNDRLMTGNGTANITNPPPNLISTEVNTMRKSNCTIKSGDR